MCAQSIRSVLQPIQDAGKSPGSLPRTAAMTSGVARTHQQADAGEKKPSTKAGPVRRVMGRKGRLHATGRPV